MIYIMLEFNSCINPYEAIIHPGPDYLNPVQLLLSWNTGRLNKSIPDTGLALSHLSDNTEGDAIISKKREKSSNLMNSW